MICMVYISSAKLGLTEGEIIHIVEDARVNNEKNQITGLLLFNRGTFMQLIEGNEPTIEALYEKIRKDNRHTDVNLLVTESIIHRNFSTWTMGFKNIEKLKKINPLDMGIAGYSISLPRATAYSSNGRWECSKQIPSDFSKSQR